MDGATIAAFSSVGVTSLASLSAWIYTIFKNGESHAHWKGKVETNVKNIDDRVRSLEDDRAEVAHDLYEALGNINTKLADTNTYIDTRLAGTNKRIDDILFALAEMNKRE